jgi:hypothetical protein
MVPHYSRRRITNSNQIGMHIQIQKKVTGRHNFLVQYKTKQNNTDRANAISSYIPGGALPRPRPANPILNILPSPNAAASEGRDGPDG